ncbi:Gfo/Idh/MocA family protein [Candidatus Ferrigenium straubiae]|jgi:predicted dehydrogenase|uniref:Gfo/Idh/MocA family protein n=1 Tax=Candidatus Ferrigenium straubiae TaxID=2919506 RepID=UPI003F4ACC2D
MRVLVVGFGSIGQRHARLLKELGCEVAVVSSREIEHPVVFCDIGTALEEWKPEYVVLANKTHEHHSVLSTLAQYDFEGRVLVEKPLFDQVYEVPPNRFACLAVAYNLRFHPLINRLRDFLVDQRPLSAFAYVGQYLPQWRPSTDYRCSYSAKRSEGGGVLRDLSHELDYMRWLFGDWVRLTAIGGHFSHLEIDSDDFYTLLLEMNACPLVSIHVNYLDRVARREVLVHTDQHSLKIDFVKGTIDIDGNTELVNVERDVTYLDEHKAMLAGDFAKLCNYKDGLAVMKMIDSAEIAAKKEIWVTAHG